jgi:hypothetical protein
MTNLLSGERTPFRPQPSRAGTIAGGFASFFHPFPGGKEIFAAMEEDLALEIIGGLEQSKTAMFDEQYLSTGGQLYELMMGRDRMLVDVRGLLYKKFAREGLATGHSCHPYDLCTVLIAEECGVQITDGAGKSLDAPLDTTSDVSWVGYANAAIRREVEPVLMRLLAKYQLI